MKTIKQLTAKVLEVTVATDGYRYDENDNEEICEKLSSYEILEFENGLILVEGDTTNNCFFESREDFEPCGMDRVVSIEETGETRDWSSEELLNSIQGSIREFGEDSVPSKHLELWK